MNALMVMIEGVNIEMPGRTTLMLDVFKPIPKIYSSFQPIIPSMVGQNTNL